MTTDQLIALAASIGACLSAIATFLTVRQIAEQREASYRPELAFSRVLFDAKRSLIRSDSLPDSWMERAPNSTPMPSLDEISIPLRNVGLGTAKAVTITWSFEIEKIISEVNEAAQRTLTPAYFTVEEGIVSVKSEILGATSSIWRNQRRMSVDFILPASVEKESTKIRLPHAYIQLCSAVLFFAVKDKERVGAFSPPALIAKIEFSDIGNKSYKSAFIFEVNIIAIASSGESFHGYLECTKQA